MNRLAVAAVGLTLIVALMAPHGSSVRAQPVATSGGPTVIATIPVGTYPALGVGVNATTNRIYVNNSGSNNISVIDGATNTEIDTDGNPGNGITRIPVGSGPAGLAVNPATNRIYVSNQMTNNVSVIDGATNTEIDTDGDPGNGITRIPVGSGPVGVAVNPTTNRIYVNNFSWGSGSVSVIDGATNTEIDTDADPGNGITRIPVGDRPHLVAVNTITNRVYVANWGTNDVSVIDGASNTVVATIPVGTYPIGVAINPTTNRIYVSNSFLDISDVSVIDGTTNTEIDTDGDPGNGITRIPVGSGPAGLSANPTTNRVYVANTQSDDVSVIDQASNTVVYTVSVGNRPYGVGVNPTTNRIYVTNVDSGSVTVMEETGSGDNYKLSVPSFQQCYAPWGDDIYDAIDLYVSGRADVCWWGCALTSAVDVLGFWGVSTTPGSLNQWLGGFSGGYSPGGYLNWNAVAEYSREQGVQLATPKVYWDSDTTALRDSLDSGRPVILGVPFGGRNPGHWVVAIGPNVGTWWINDPGGVGGVTLDAYGNTFSRRVVYEPNSGNNARLILRAHSPVEMVVTDPQGRRLGFDPTSGTSYAEIPDASYGLDGGIAGGDGSGEEIPGVKTAWLNAPIDGEYTLDVIGTDTGSYGVDGEAYDQEGSHSHVEGPTGTTSPGQVDSAVIQYSSEPPAVGGIAQLADVAGAPLNASDSAAGGEGSLAVLAGILAPAVCVTVVGVWFARRRWAN